MASRRPTRRHVDTVPPEALLADYPLSHAVLAERLRTIVKDVVPDAIERVRPGWRLIGYDLAGTRHGSMFAWIWPEPEHVHLGFPRGVDIDDPNGHMRGEGITKLARWLTYAPGDEIDEALAATLVEEAARVALIPRSAR